MWEKKSKAPVSQPVNEKCFAHHRPIFERPFDPFLTKSCRNVVKGRTIRKVMGGGGGGGWGKYKNKIHARAGDWKKNHAKKK